MDLQQMTGEVSMFHTFSNHFLLLKHSRFSLSRVQLGKYEVPSQDPFTLFPNTFIYPAFICFDLNL